jgi:hypothetical protein
MVPFLLKLDKFNGHFARRPGYDSVLTSLNIEELYLLGYISAVL